MEPLRVPVKVVIEDEDEYWNCVYLYDRDNDEPDGERLLAVTTVEGEDRESTLRTMRTLAAIVNEYAAAVPLLKEYLEVLDDYSATFAYWHGVRMEEKLAQVDKAIQTAATLVGGGEGESK